MEKIYPADNVSCLLRVQNSVATSDHFFIRQRFCIRWLFKALMYLRANGDPVYHYWASCSCSGTVHIIKNHQYCHKTKLCIWEFLSLILGEVWILLFKQEAFR